MYWYAESRGGVYPETLVCGIQGGLRTLFPRPITHDDVNYADALITEHMGHGVFNRGAFRRIVDEFGGYPPLRVRSVPEGLVVPTRNVLLTVESSLEDSSWAWVPGFYETAIQRALWYPTTVATVSYHMRKLILRYLEETGRPENVNFALHDFGYRGVSSEESAGIGGFAHLINFQGTDNVAALEYVRKHYGASLGGYSIPASEHSIVMSWPTELEAFAHILDTYGMSSMVAAVSDTHDVYEAVDVLWGQMLKERVQRLPAQLVIRPDSGEPNQVVRKIFELLGNRFGYTVNNKGYKVLNTVRVIQGDGVDLEETGRILEALKLRGWSTDPLAFGMGGALLQKLDRDTQRFAMKPSYIKRGTQYINVSKQPSTDPGKWSKSGKIKLVKDGETFSTVPYDTPGLHDILDVVWDTGTFVRQLTTLAEIRARALGGGGR
jgi:nicotinamide phosphoribosyltransferase